uniref:Uncharacterized protein n=1 Tax=Panagrolaimus sp. JU765 TaxID=591449 RepID=A0AC34RGP0_9BILA
MCQTERQRRFFDPLTISSSLFCLLLAMMLSTSASASSLPSEYLRFTNDEDPKSDQSVFLTPFRELIDDEPRTVLLFRAGRPIALKDLAAAIGKPTETAISKRSDDTMLRLTRNMPQQEKMYQVNSISDLPMFRFG